MTEFVVNAIGLGAKPGFLRWVPSPFIFFVTIGLFERIIFGPFENRH